MIGLRVRREHVVLRPEGSGRAICAGCGVMSAAAQALERRPTGLLPFWVLSALHGGRHSVAVGGGTRVGRRGSSAGRIRRIGRPRFEGRFLMHAIMRTGKSGVMGPAQPKALMEYREHRRNAESRGIWG